MPDAAPDALSDLLAAARAELDATTAALAQMRSLRADRVDDDEHDPEGSPLSSEWARLDGLRRAAERRVTAAGDAVAHAAAGRYGRCARCGGPIAAGRLEALPAAIRCVRCA
jgi:DnaK suppressor protein